MRNKRRLLFFSLVATTCYILISYYTTNTHTNFNEIYRWLTNINRTSVSKTVTASTKSPPLRNVATNKITVLFIGGIGNKMFQYAAAFAFGMRYNYKPVFFHHSAHALYRTFALSTNDSYDDLAEVNLWAAICESRACAYDLAVEKNFLSPQIARKNITLHGFFQSWKYFQDYSADLRKEFTFRTEIIDNAQAFLSQAIAKNLPPRTNNYERPLLIGVHVRRGDMLQTYNKARGYTVASASYIQKAMKYFTDKFSQAVAKNHFMFVVATNDISWAMENIRYANIPIVFSQNASAEVDLAILASCNHTIATVGTFSWWAGWLAGGITVYYRNFPRPKSFLSNIFNSSDHWLPEWVGLDD